jgi:hypothetical protein
VVARITIAPSPEIQRRVREQARALGFAPDASLSSIYTALAEEGYRALARRLAEAEMARTYEAWAQDPTYRADNQAEVDMAFQDGLL